MASRPRDQLLLPVAVARASADPFRHLHQMFSVSVGLWAGPFPWPSCHRICRYYAAAFDRLFTATPSLSSYLIMRWVWFACLLELVQSAERTSTSSLLQNT